MLVVNVELMKITLVKFVVLPLIAKEMILPVGGPPSGNEHFMSLTCGQDVEFPVLTGTATILMLCNAFNGTQP